MVLLQGYKKGKKNYHDIEALRKTAEIQSFIQTLENSHGKKHAALSVAEEFFI